jgi:cell division protein FtsB
MSQPERQWSASPLQLATVILAIVSLYMFASVVTRAINIVDLTRQQALLQTRLDKVAQETNVLRDEAQYLQSDAYLELVAHGVLYWALPGEKLIIPLDSTTRPGLSPTPLTRP